MFLLFNNSFKLLKYFILCSVVCISEYKDNKKLTKSRLFQIQAAFLFSKEKIYLYTQIENLNYQ